MASVGHLQLFPPPPNQQQPAKLKRKASRRKTPQAMSPASEVDNGLSPTSVYSTASKLPITEEIVIHISPSTKRTARNQPNRVASPDVTTIPERAQTTSPMSMTSEATLVRSNSQTSDVPAMRSMFPQYNPILPQPQRQSLVGHPSVATSMTREAMDRDMITPTVVYAKPAQNSRDTKKMLSPASACSTSFANTFQNMPPPQYSSPRELEELWNAANGQDVSESGRTYALRMKKDGIEDPTTKELVPAESESYTFCSSKSTPFYDFQTLKENTDSVAYSECVVRRHDPLTKAAIPIMFTNIEPPARQLTDGLIAEIYPKTAAMMALDEAKDQPEHLAGELMRAATQRECCRLLWNNDKQKYHLYHPSLHSKTTGKGGQSFVFHFEGGTAGFDVPNATGTITLVNVESGDTLVSLEFGTATLLVNTASTSKVASLYIVDVAVTALLLVAVVDGRRVRANTFAPPPTSKSIISPATSTPPRQKSPKREQQPTTPQPPAQAQTTTLGAAGRTKLGDEEQGFARPPYEAARDERLPGSTKGVLSLLFGAYKAVVWVLGALVSALARIVIVLSDKKK